ncbi:MAG: mitochondrial import receptor protein [Pleopsidium flavum]|nr:MAG: mitochondrial import receptor protein [Pleopsidium flavum]
MVKLEEVEDDHFTQEQPGPKPENDDDFYTDTDSEISSDDDLPPASDETLTDRLLALRDILPPAQRRYLTSTLSTASSWAKSGLMFSGKGLWAVSTSVVFLGVPWVLAWMEEQGIVEMEKEAKMAQSANEVSLFLSVRWSSGDGRGDGRGDGMEGG